MISPTVDKKEYLETMREENTPGVSYDDFLPKILGTGDEFKNKLITSQWKYTKEQLKKNENPRTLVETGDLYLLRNNYKKAIDYYQRSLILDPEYLRAYEQIILAYSLHNKYTEAQTYFNELLKITKEREDIFKKYSLFRINSLFINGGDVDETLEIIKRALDSSPNDIELINALGFIELNLKKDINLAEKYFDQVLKIKKDYIHSLNNKGVCNLRNKKIEEAEEIFKKSIKIAPRNYPFSHQNLALVYIQKNKYDLAYKTLNEAVVEGVKIQNDWQHLIGWLLIHVNKFEEAAVWYKNKIKEEPKNQLLFNNLGFCYSQLGNRNEAEKKFREAVDINEQKIKSLRIMDTRAFHAYYNLGRITIMNGNMREAKKIATRIQEIKGQDIDAFAKYMNGAIKNYNEDYDGAKSLFEEALSLDEKIPEIYPDYSFILESIDKNYEKAIEVLERALDLGFRQVLIYNNLAFSYIKNGDLKKAEKIFNLFKDQKNDEMPPILFATFGLFEIKKGNLKKGNEFYDKAIEKLDKGNKVIATQIQLLENARFAYEHKKIEAAVNFLNDAKKLPKSYVNRDIDELEQKISI